MTAFIVAGIYWQAMKIFLKGIPYIPYDKERSMNSVARDEQQVVERAYSLSTRWTRSIFFKLVAQIQHGQIILRDGEKVTVFGDDKRLSATITVLDQRFYTKVLLGGSIGAGEAYVDNFWKTDDLTMLVRIMARNMTTARQTGAEILLGLPAIQNSEAQIKS